MNPRERQTTNSMLDRITSTLLMKPAAAEYAKRAAYYRNRAGADYVSQGISEHINGSVEGKRMVDLVDGTDKSLQFAFDRDGIAFARIEDGKYYPIEGDPGRYNLERARENEKLANSFFRRLFNRRFESLDRTLFDLSVQTNKTSDVVLQTQTIVHQKTCS